MKLSLSYENPSSKYVRNYVSSITYSFEYNLKYTSWKYENTLGVNLACRIHSQSPNNMTLTSDFLKTLCYYILVQFEHSRQFNIIAFDILKEFLGIQNIFQNDPQNNGGSNQH